MTCETVRSAPRAKSLQITPVAVSPHYVESKRYASLVIRNLMIKLRESPNAVQLSLNGIFAFGAGSSCKRRAEL